jgi:AGZA family xanthine/uracil permease-like MFS transporter
VNAGFIVHHPATVIGMGKLNPSLWFCFGLFLTPANYKNVKGAVLLGMWHHGAGLYPWPDMGR